MTLLDSTSDDLIDVDPAKNYLEELVGEGKKFQTPEELAKGKFYADQTIEIYKRQMDALREELMKEKQENMTRARLEEVMDKLANQSLTSNDEPSVKEDYKPAFDPEQFRNLAREEFLTLKAQETEQSNYNTVKAKLIERYGNNYQNVLSKQAVDLGMSGAEIDSMAKKHPQAFIRMFGLDAPAQNNNFQAPPRSQGFAPTSGPKRTWSYYQELKKNNRDVYFDPKTQQQMLDDYASMGKDFEDGNFYEYN